MFSQQFRVESARLVVIGERPHLKGQILLRLVVGVLRQNHHAVLGSRLNQLFAKSGFARARTACQAHDERLGHDVWVMGSPETVARSWA